MFCRNNETPMAVIRTLRRGAARMRFVRQPLDREAHQRAQGHRSDEHRSAGPPGHGGPALRLPVLLQHPRERQAQPRAQHHHVAVREVDELQDAVHHRVAQRDERVQAADGDAVLQRLEQLVHARRVRGVLLGLDGRTEDPVAAASLDHHGVLHGVAVVVESDAAGDAAVALGLGDGVAQVGARRGTWPGPSRRRAPSRRRIPRPPARRARRRSRPCTSPTKRVISGVGLSTA